MRRRIINIAVGIIFVGLLGWLTLACMAAQYRIDKMNFIISDYQGVRDSGLTESGLVQYARDCGCTVESSADSYTFKVGTLWIRKTWVVTKTKVSPN
jgi:hypothetical protein